MTGHHSSTQGRVMHPARPECSPQLLRQAGVTATAYEACATAGALVECDAQRAGRTPRAGSPRRRWASLSTSPPDSVGPRRPTKGSSPTRSRAIPLASPQGRGGSGMAGRATRHGPTQRAVRRRVRGMGAGPGRSHPRRPRGTIRQPEGALSSSGCRTARGGGCLRHNVYLYRYEAELALPGAPSTTECSSSVLPVRQATRCH